MNCTGEVRCPHALASHQDEWGGHRRRFFFVCRLGYCHRDVKPDNILLRRGCQEVVLADFGLTRKGLYASPETLRLTSAVVTTAYAPPEILARTTAACVYTESVDVWSLGIVLLEMLVGSTTLRIDTERACYLREVVMKTFTKDNLARLCSIAAAPRGLADLLQWMLAPDPRHRPTIRQVIESPYVATILVPPEDVLASLASKSSVSPAPMFKSRSEDAADVVVTAWLEFATTHHRGPPRPRPWTGGGGLGLGLPPWLAGAAAVLTAAERRAHVFGSALGALYRAWLRGWTYAFFMEPCLAEDCGFVEGDPTTTSRFFRAVYELCAADSVQSLPWRPNNPFEFAPHRAANKDIAAVLTALRGEVPDEDPRVEFLAALPGPKNVLALGVACRCILAGRELCVEDLMRC